MGEGGWRGGGRRRGEDEMGRGRRRGEVREEGWGSAEGRGGENAMRAATGEGATTLAGFRSSKSICFVTSEASGAPKVLFS